MLSQLYIKNIAVISEASIDFGPRFNVFTGETGAGKTILVSAINGVLGARMSRDIIRSGEDSAYVSALFTQLPQDVCAKIEEMGFEMQDDLNQYISRLDGDTQTIIRLRFFEELSLKEIADIEAMEEVCRHGN